MTAPTPIVCPRCDGSRVQALRWAGNWSLEPCEECCCTACGRTTDTPPLCERHQREKDDLDAAKAWREGR